MKHCRCGSQKKSNIVMGETAQSRYGAESLRPHSHMIILFIQSKYTTHRGRVIFGLISEVVFVWQWFVRLGC